MKEYYYAKKEQKIGPLNLRYLTKKQSVFQKTASFVEKFKGVGGSV
ncbi:hypothetical protein [Polaribacter sp. IC073]|nr:hypothetical protein [Polaribacter sp. IC073]